MEERPRGLSDIAQLAARLCFWAQYHLRQFAQTGDTRFLYNALHCLAYPTKHTYSNNPRSWKALTEAWMSLSSFLATRNFKYLQEAIRALEEAERGYYAWAQLPEVKRAPMSDGEFMPPWKRMVTSTADWFAQADFSTIAVIILSWFLMGWLKSSKLLRSPYARQIIDYEIWVRWKRIEPVLRIEIPEGYRKVLEIVRQLKGFPPPR